MPTIWIKEFTGGLDTRRMPETTPGGVLTVAQDGHITRGGEFEVRAAFVPEYVLPAGETTGLAYDKNGIYVFGTAASSAVPTDITYQQLDPGTADTLESVLSFDLFAGKLYAVGLFGNGAIHHFYDGNIVTDWVDGRSRGAFYITAGTSGVATPATGSFEVTGGSLGGGNELSALTINSVSLITSAVAHTGNNATTAADIAAEINSTTSSPNYTATSNGQTVNITAVTAGAAINGKAIVPTVGGTMTTGNVVNMNGGLDASTVTSKITDITVDGVSIINAPISWTTSNAATAALVASAISSYTSSPDYTGTSAENRVNIIAVDEGTAPNGRQVVVQTTGGMGISQPFSAIMTGGSDDSEFQPGSFVKTSGSKMYSTSGPNLHFSGILQPTQWTTDAVGAGFIDMSSQSSGSEELRAVAPYQGYLAIFAADAIQIEYVDPDPSLNKLSQVLSNTGTVSGRSVTQFGDADLFYCANSGLRSLRARTGTTSASTTDIGVPVDTLVTERLATLTEAEREQIIGLVEPTEGRFWLIVKDTIFVLSFFNGAEISAWSIYKPGFDITDAVVYQRRVYLRGGDTIYVYGGLGASTVYDDTQAIARLPFQDANEPWRRKDWFGIDAAAIGTWEMTLRTDPTGVGQEYGGAIEGTTFPENRRPINGRSTHLSVEFRSTGGYAKLASALLHYLPDAASDEVRE